MGRPWGPFGLPLCSQGHPRATQRKTFENPSVFLVFPCAGSIREGGGASGKDISGRAVNVHNENPSHSLSGSSPTRTRERRAAWDAHGVLLGWLRPSLGHLGTPMGSLWGGFGPLWVILGCPWGPFGLPLCPNVKPLKTLGFSWFFHGAGPRGPIREGHLGPGC